MVGSARPTAATVGKGLKANQVSLKGDVWSGAGQHVSDEEAVGAETQLKLQLVGAAAAVGQKAVGTHNRGALSECVRGSVGGSGVVKNRSVCLLAPRLQTSCCLQAAPG